MYGKMQETPLTLKAIVESLIFTSPEPVTIHRLSQVLEGEADRAAIKQAIEEIEHDLENENRGVTLVEVAGGYQFRTKPQAAPWVRRIHDVKGRRLSKASMETLAIVAYRQPITRAELEKIRGVESGWILRSLVEKDLVRILGRKDEPGNPILYGTTKRFLEAFGLKSLSDLPELPETQKPEENKENTGEEKLSLPEDLAAAAPAGVKEDIKEEGENTAPAEEISSDDAASVEAEVKGAEIEHEKHEEEIKKEEVST